MMRVIFFSSLEKSLLLCIKNLSFLQNISKNLYLCSRAYYMLIFFGKKEALCPILVCTKPEKLPNDVTRKVVIVSTHSVELLFPHLSQKVFSGPVH